MTWFMQIFALLFTFFVLAPHDTDFQLPWNDFFILLMFFLLTTYVSVKDGQYKVDLSLAARRAFQQYSEAS